MENSDAGQKRNRIFSHPIAAIVILLILLLIAYFAVAFMLMCRDEPAPNVDDLAVVRANLPDSENAIGLFRLAAGAMVLPEETNDSWHKITEMLDGDMEWDDDWVKDVLERNIKMFEHLDAGLEMSRLEVPEVKTPDADVQYLSDWRSLSRLAMLRALQEQRDGNDAQAFEHALAVVKMGDMFERSGGSLIHCLVGMATKKAALRGLRQLLEETTLTADQLLSCRHRLVEFESNREGLANSLRAEFLSSSNLLSSLQKKGNPFVNENKPLKPGFLFKPNQTQRWMAECYRSMIWNTSRMPSEWREEVSVELSDALQPKDDWRKRLAFLRDGNAVGKTITGMTVFAVARSNLERLTVDFEARATQAMIAMKCYKMEHGQLPESLDVLVPDYLTAVPVDPVDGKALEYSAKEKEIRARKIEGISKTPVIEIPF